MTRSVEKSGNTVEEAVQDALKDLGLPSDEVEIEILEEPSRGILGLVGQRLARVKVILFAFSIIRLFHFHMPKS
jgi:spoIIIJ-associated protein